MLYRLSYIPTHTTSPSTLHPHPRYIPTNATSPSTLHPHPQCYDQGCTVLEHLLDKVSLSPAFQRTRRSGDAQRVRRTPDLQETGSVIVNKTWKVEVHITDNQSWSGCCSGLWSWIYSPFSYTAYKAQGASALHYTWPLTSAKTWSPCGPNVLVNTSVALTWVWNLVGNNSRPVRGIMKIMGHEITTVFSIGPIRSWWGLERSAFWGFNRSMTRDQWKCAWLLMTVTLYISEENLL